MFFNHGDTEVTEFHGGLPIFESKKNHYHFLKNISVFLYALCASVVLCFITILIYMSLFNAATSV